MSVNQSLSSIKKEEAEILGNLFKIKYGIWNSSLPANIKKELDEELRSFTENITEGFDFVYGKADQVGNN